ncbi:MAG: DUF126 domain-containing protein [Desulfurococcales archaeon]|nr:DUF126 domain-containing protein [Desulfurococcales archaeon]
MPQLVGEPIVPGDAEGEAVVAESLSFYGEVDPQTGLLVDGRSIAGRILVLGRARGSTVGSYIIYALAKNKKAPRAIIIAGRPDPILITGAILANIPLYKADPTIMKTVRDGSRVRITNNTIYIE